MLFGRFVLHSNAVVFGVLPSFKLNADAIGLDEDVFYSYGSTDFNISECL